MTSAVPLRDVCPYCGFAFHFFARCIVGESQLLTCGDNDCREQFVIKIVVPFPVLTVRALKDVDVDAVLDRLAKRKPQSEPEPVPASTSPVANRAADKPEAPDRSAASPATGTAPPASSGPAPSHPRVGARPDVPDHEAVALANEHRRVTELAGRKRAPFRWNAAHAARLKVSEQAVERAVIRGRLLVAEAANGQRATPPVSEPRVAPLTEPRERVSAPPSVRPQPPPKKIDTPAVDDPPRRAASKPALKDRALTGDEVSELSRRCDIVTRNRSLSIPYDWARQRGEELGVPATTIFAALTKTTPKKERDPMKALETPAPRVRRMYGRNYGVAE